MSGSEGSWLAGAGRRPDWAHGLVNPPVHRASTILFKSVAAMEAALAERERSYTYARRGTPSQWALEEALTGLEPGAEGTVLLPSGLAAIAVALLAILKPGDRLLMVDSVYEPTRHFCGTILRRYGVETIYYDPLTTPDLGGARALFLESPGSLSFEVQDVPALCAAARERGVTTLIDNTWATPLFFRALKAGVDIAILAGTKYVGGHADVMMGSITAAGPSLRAVQQTASIMGLFLPPDDAFLALRGLRTLELRLKRHEESALAVARWLADQSQVARVLHPALPSCPGHELWKRDFRGSSGLFTFELNGGGKADRDRLIDSLEHFGIGFSWGGFESLALPVDLRRARTAAPPETLGPAVRLHIGLEDPSDLIADLSAALSRYPAQE